MIIALGKLVEDFEIVSTAGRDLGRAVKTEKITRPEVLVWILEGTDEDLQKAKKFASEEGYQVFTFPETETDPLKRTKEKLKNGQI